MLINAVILFLRDALPVLVLISILAAIIYRHSDSTLWLTKGLALGLLGLIIQASFINPISDWFDGFGFEMITTLSHLLVYCALLGFILCRNENRMKLAVVIVALLITTSGTNVYIYLNGFWSDPHALDALLVGTALGLGISLSLAVLLYYALRSELIDSVPQLPMIVLSLAAARQVTEAVYFLIQADWLQASTPLWNTSAILSDSSEFGHLFNALTGYEASPSTIQVVFHLIALGSPLLLIYKTRHVNLKEVTS